ncbi:MAG: hypothetical protein DCC67_01475 [Planctomycetota bacterium]|nr:MAG: hypothetical protein DCC67_01475 [Planctomycetota bacterium]
MLAFARPCSGQVVATPMLRPGQNFGQNLQVANGPRGAVTYLYNFNGSLVTLPASPQGAGYSPQSGLQLSINIDWPGQYGYRPVDLTVRTAKPTTQEQRITVRFNAGDYSSKGRSIEVEDSFLFPRGATTASGRILVPQYQDWYMLGWRVWIDGRPDDFLAVKDASGFQLGPGATNMGVILAGTTVTQTSAYQVALQGAYSGSAVSVKPMALAELPVDWLEYSTLDVVIIPAAELITLVERHREQATGLLRWVRAGGNLWVTEAGQDWRRLATIDEALDSPAAADAPKAAEPEGADSPEALQRELAARGWRRPPTNERASEPTEAALLLSGFETGQSALALLPKIVSAPLAEAIGSYFRPPPGRHFLVRGYGLGAITAFRTGLGGSFNPAGNPLFVSLNQTLLQPRISWATRHGNQPNGFNPDFNKLLIADVGVAPVGMFQILITLFVVGIGPLNYWLLRRRNKLPMLLFTVPAAAVATTAVLFAYGLFADGFGVKVRARTLTLLDQRAGEAASWGRLSYYAGISPRGGLKIPRSQAMYPMYPEWAVGYRTWTRNLQPLRELVWANDQQLTRGWLASRTPTQYQAVSAGASNRKLELRVTARGLRVVNRLGVDVTHLAVEDHQGRVYWCENLPVDQGQLVPETDWDKVNVQIRRLFTENLPEAPVGADSGYTGAGFDFTASQSIMEGRLGAINSALVRSWGKGRYIAFTQQAIGIDLGVDGADEQASFHVVEGRW